ncbi:hypothetical protein PG994_002416 [Apiospora phragmitis]|uniref:Uncharacterized protein n=1 Tax=Apiospora phragmitis TaxID=2905665 RepID=A0ABR1WW98_9PEZI
MKAIDSKLSTSSDATASKTQTSFTALKDSMGACSASGVLSDAPNSGVPLGHSGNGTYGAGNYPGPVGTSGAAATATAVVSCSAMLVAAVVAFLV